MNTDNAVLLYTSEFDARVLTVAQTYLSDSHRLPNLVTSGYAPIPGVPALRPEWGRTDRLHNADRVVPVDYNDWDMRQALNAFTGNVQSCPFARSAVPEPVIPELGTVLYDPLKKQVAVYTGAHPNGLPPVWEGPAPTTERVEYGTLLRHVRTQLVAAEIAVFPTTVYAPALEHPWWDPAAGEMQAIYISNLDARVPVVGYAYTPREQELVYLSIVGYKTACRSIWGSLNTHNKRTLWLGERHQVTSTHHYASAVSTPIDPDAGLIRLQMADKRCVSAAGDEEVFLLVPHGWDEAATARAFAVRLNALLPWGFNLGWGVQLLQAGQDNDLVKPLTVGGDLAAGYRIQAAGWLDLFNTLMTEGVLA